MADFLQYAELNPLSHSSEVGNSDGGGIVWRVVWAELSFAMLASTDLSRVVVAAALASPFSNLASHSNRNRSLPAHRHLPSPEASRA